MIDGATHALAPSSDGGRPPGDAAALAAAVSSLGVRGNVEGRAGLAVLTAGGAELVRLADAAVRRALLALASEHGFTHLAVELADAGAIVPDAAGGRAPLLRD